MIPQDSIKPALNKPTGIHLFFLTINLETKQLTYIICPTAGWGMRHLVTFMGFWGFAMSYSMRFNLSIAIVAMVKRNSSKPVTPGNNSILSFISTNISEGSSGPACPSAVIHSGNSGGYQSLLWENSSEGEFEWDEVQQGIILGAFFWGYMLTQLPGGVISQRFGNLI